MSRKLVPLVLLFVMPLEVSCFGGGGATPGPGQIASTVVGQIERTRDAIQSESIAWREGLQDLEASLADDVSSIIRNDVNGIHQRAISAVSLETRCTVDFLRERVVEELNGLLARLTGQTPVLLMAKVCNTIPTNVAMYSRPSVVEFLGYDFAPGTVALHFHDGAGTK